MKKTYITTMPNHIGAFLKASECFASLDINITRVSYNKAIDSHTLFIDAGAMRNSSQRLISNWPTSVISRLTKTRTASS